jgi:hypothetical protein
MGRRQAMRVYDDESGAVLVEVTIVMSVMLVFVLGAVEFLLVFYQWNAAAKATQIGARLAAVSDPVAGGLNELSNASITLTLSPGAVMPHFVIACDGSTARCVCSDGGLCPKDLSYNATAMNTIVFGRASASCTDATSFYQAGMCDVYPQISPANVLIVYAQTGLGFSGRPGGPAPTITVSLKNLPLPLTFLKSFAGLNQLTMPALQTSITAEDLSSIAPGF